MVNTQRLQPNCAVQASATLFTFSTSASALAATLRGIPWALEVNILTSPGAMLHLPVFAAARAFCGPRAG